MEILTAETAPSALKKPDPIQPQEAAGVKIEALLAYSTGFVHHKLGNLEKAQQYFKIAISTDVYCYEALELLLEYHLLTSVDG